MAQVKDAATRTQHRQKNTQKTNRIACPHVDMKRWCRPFVELVSHRFPTSTSFDHDGIFNLFLVGG